MDTIAHSSKLWKRTSCQFAAQQWRRCQLQKFCRMSAATLCSQSLISAHNRGKPGLRLSTMPKPHQAFHFALGGIAHEGCVSMCICIRQIALLSLLSVQAWRHLTHGSASARVACRCGEHQREKGRVRGISQFLCEHCRLAKAIWARSIYCWSAVQMRMRRTGQAAPRCTGKHKLGPLLPMPTVGSSHIGLK